MLHITIIQNPSTAVIVVLTFLCLVAGAEGSPLAFLRCKSRACSVGSQVTSWPSCSHRCLHAIHETLETPSPNTSYVL